MVHSKEYQNFMHDVIGLFNYDGSVRKGEKGIFVSVHQEYSTIKERQGIHREVYLTLCNNGEATSTEVSFSIIFSN